MYYCKLSVTNSLAFCLLTLRRTVYHCYSCQSSGKVRGGDNSKRWKVSQLNYHSRGLLTVEVHLARREASIKRRPDLVGELKVLKKREGEGRLYHKSIYSNWLGIRAVATFKCLDFYISLEYWKQDICFVSYR